MAGLRRESLGKVVTTDHEHDFCERCRALARQRGFTVTEHPVVRWAR